jgi:Gpi18-like mannosyltransferase
LTGEYPLTAIALSNIFLFLALFVLHKTVLAFGYDQEIAGRTVIYTALFPASYFFSLPWTTSLFLLTVAAAFWAAKREQYWWAGFFAALASATHYSGIFVFPSLLILYWQSIRPLKFRVSALGLLLAPAGLSIFMAYLYHLTGNAFAFADAQSAWRVRWGLFLPLCFSDQPVRTCRRLEFPITEFCRRCDGFDLLLCPAQATRAGAGLLYPPFSHHSAFDPDA